MKNWTRILLRSLPAVLPLVILATQLPVAQMAHAQPSRDLSETGPVIKQKPRTASQHTLPGEPALEEGKRSLETNDHHPFPYEVILIDVGHGGIDGGTSHGDLLEKDINLAISRRLFMLLRSAGYHAILNRDADYALSDDNRWHASRSRHRRDLAQRKQLSSEIPTKLVVSIHVNWSKSKARSGGMVLHQAEGRSFLLAEAIQRQLNRIYPSRHHTEVGRPFYLLNQTRVPAVIVETGFISCASDRQKLCSRKGQMEIAGAVASGIMEYLTAL